MKKNVKNLLALTALFVFCVVLSLGLGFAAQKSVVEAPVRKKNLSEAWVNAVSIADVSGVMKMTAVNYVPDEFVELNKTVSNENSGKNPAKRGTYRFYIDSLVGDEWANAEKLNRLLKSDGNWHLTMYIPPVFSSCCVYVRYQSKEYVGRIDGYNVAYYTNFSAPSKFDDSVTHETATEPLFIDIPVSTESKYSKECSVTVHYESDNDNFLGISGEILIGEDSEVRKAASQNRSTLLIGAIIGTSTLLLFVFICILKHSLTFVPQLLFATGVFLELMSAYSLTGLTAAPYFLLGLRRFSVGLIVFASTLYLPEKIGKIRVLYPVSGVSAAAALLAFISPFITSVSVYNAFCVIYSLLYVVCIALVFALTIRDVIEGEPIGFKINGVISWVLVVTAFFTEQSTVSIMLSPALWLSLAMLGVTIVLGFREFISAEIKNNYLTTNLEHEVAKQTGSLQTVIAERDKILMYVSHDMKKTVVSMGDALFDLRQYVTSPEICGKVDYLLQKNAELKKDFADLSKYGKRNYVAEQSEVLDLSEIINKVAGELRPDCEANGIYLTVSVPKKLDVYAKKIALESVILNLVLNAIEHSFCQTLTVSAAKRKGYAEIEIIDDGKGVTTDKNIFEPFVSGDQKENNSGLGLFLAKSAIESMHGELKYERKNDLTVFSATLPLA